MTLIDYMQDFYKDSPFMQAVLSAFDNGIDCISAAADEAKNNLFVSTASSYGLSLWEKELGIVPEASASLAYRRSVVLARLRGLTTTTAAAIENVAESFSGGAAAVEEDSAGYTVKIKFVGTLGVPPNMDDFKRAIEEILPAHIAYELIYLYATLGMYAGHTLGSIGAYTLGELGDGQPLE